MRPCRIAVALLLSCFCSVFGQSGAQQFAAAGVFQTPTSSGARHNVTGTVVNSVTGEPIRRALVNANGAETHHAFSGADGRLEITDVPEGQVVFWVQKPGFLDPRNGGPSSRSDAVQVGSATDDMVLQLIPEAKIRRPCSG